MMQDGVKEGAKAGFARVDALLQRLAGQIEPGATDGDTTSMATEVLGNG